MTGTVNQIIKLSYVDGPGARAAIFLQGCNFNCLYCHNPETIQVCDACGECVRACPVGALEKPKEKVLWDGEKCTGCDACIQACQRQSSPKACHLTPQQVFAKIGSAARMIRGITLSGGEATQQCEFATKLFALAKSKGLSTFLDSNGAYDFEKDKQLLKVTDAVMLDIKAYDLQAHLELTGQPNHLPLRNLSFLGGIDKLYEVRTVIAQDLPGAQETVAKVSKAIAGFETRYKLIRYRPHGVRGQGLEQLKPPTDLLMDELAQIARENGTREVIVL